MRFMSIRLKKTQQNNSNEDEERNFVILKEFAGKRYFCHVVRPNLVAINTINVMGGAIARRL